MAAKTLFAVAAALAVFSAVTAAEESRTGQTEQCAKQGLCPYVRRLIPEMIGQPIGVHQSPVQLHPPSMHYPMLGPVQHPALFYYPHHVHRRDAAAPHIEASVCGNLCTHDHVCPGTKKCCPTECGFSCFDPVHLAY